MTIKDREFDLVIRKFGFQTRENDHYHAWFEFNGQVITRTRRSHQRGDLPMEHAIRQQMRLSEKQLREAITCTFSRDDYIENLRARGLIKD